MKALADLVIVAATNAAETPFTEPAVLLLAGSLLLVLAGAVRRIPV